MIDIVGSFEAPSTSTIRQAANSLEGHQMSASNVNIEGLSKAAVLAALYNASYPFGMGALQAKNGPEIMSEEYAQELIESGEAAPYTGMKLVFDYVYGRRLRANLSGDSFDPNEFDKNYGQYAAYTAIEQLRMSTR